MARPTILGWVTRLLPLALAVTIVAGCTRGPSPPAEHRPAGPAQTATAPGAPCPTAGRRLSGSARTRLKASGGELAKGWRRRSVVVGPLALVALRDYASTPASDYRPRGAASRR